MKILIVTGSYKNNKLKKVYEKLTEVLRKNGNIVEVISQLTCHGKGHLNNFIEGFDPFYIHVSTNDSFSRKVSRILQQLQLDYTSLCSSPDEVPDKNLIRDLFFGQDLFYKNSFRVLATTKKSESKLSEHSINSKRWIPGVDTHIFRPLKNKKTGVENNPVFLYVKNCCRQTGMLSFLESDLPGKKVVAVLKKEKDIYSEKYRDVFFTEIPEGEALCNLFNSVNVTVIPDKKQHCSLTALESLACGTPVASLEGNAVSELFQSLNPRICNDNISIAARNALSLSSDDCRSIAMKYSVEKSAERFMECQIASYF